MSYQEPAASGYGLTASEIDPAHHAIVPSDDTQDLAFRSIRAIDAKALTPYGAVSLTPERRTPKGIRPMIWVRLNETKSAAVFEVTLHTNQCVQVHVPFESWRLATCEPEAVRAAIQKAYLNLLRHKPDPVVVKPGMISLKVLSKHDPRHRTLMSVQSTTRQNSLDSTSTRTSPDSSRYNSSTNTRPSNTRQSSHSHSRSLGSRTPQRSQSHPQTVAQPPVRPNVLTKNLSMTGSKSQPQSPAGYVSVAHPGSGQQPLIRINRTGSAHGHTGYDPYTNTRYVAYGH